MTTETLTSKLSPDWNFSLEQNFDWEKAEIISINFKPESAGNVVQRPVPEAKSTRDACIIEDRILRILMVEDNQDDCELICYQLQKCGYRLRPERVFCEEMMRKALEREQWDIVFTDHGVPGFSGACAIELLERMEKPLPVICITGSIDPLVTRRMLAVGARACISKDDMSLLCATVERVLNTNPSRG